MKFFSRALSVIVFLCAPLPALAQIPGGSAVVINQTPVIDGTNGLCLYDNNGTVGEVSCGGVASLVVGSSTITGGVSGRVLYDNGGVLGEYGITGTAGSVVLSASPTIASPTFTGTVAGTNVIPYTVLAQSAANTTLGNWSGSTANVVANVMPSCPDTGTNHLNYVNGTGVTCGTGGGTGTVTTVSVVTANGFAGTVATATTTPAITLTTSVTGNVCANATALSACSTTGTGATVLANTPTLITPVLGVATGTSLALGGCTISTNAFCVTGTSLFNGNVSHASTVVVDWNSDLFLRRSAAATLALGAADAASPVAQSLKVQNVAAGATNTAGQPFSIYGSGGTGNATPVSIDIYGAGTTTSGSTQQPFGKVASFYLVNSTSSGTVAIGPSANAAVVVGGGGGLNLGLISSTFGAGFQINDGVANGGRWYGDGSSFGVGGGADSGSSASTFFPLTAPTSAILKLGKVNSATPTARTMAAEGSRSGTDTNIGGANITYQSGTGTGTGTLSVLALQSPIAVASGTGAQTQTTGLAIVGGVARRTAYTVATLPACTATTKGGMAYVTDATTPVWLTTLVGSGAIVAPAFCDGTNWVGG